MKAYLRILRHGRVFRPRLAAAFLLMLLYNVFNVFSLALTIPFLKILFASDTAAALPHPGDGSFFSSEYTQHWMSWQVQHNIQLYGKMQVLYAFCAVLLGMIILKSIFRYLSLWIMAPIELGVMQILRNDIFRHLSYLPLSFYTRHRRGNLMTLVVNDVQVVQEAVLGTIINLINDPLTMLFLLGTMLFLSWKLTLFTLIVLPLTGLVISRISKSLKRRARSGQGSLDTLVGYLDEFVGGIRIVKAFAAEQFVRNRYQAINHRFTRTMTGFRRREGMASPLNEVLSVGVVIIIILYGGSLIMSGNSPLGSEEFIGFIVIFSQFIAPLKTVSNAVSRIQKAVVSYERIRGILDQDAGRTEQDGGQPVTTFQEEIFLEKVSYQYAPDSKRVLKGIDLTIRKGETVALVGPSGGGKSTLVDLLSRFHDPTEGRILLDGTDYRQLDPHQLRQRMGIVTQEAILFNDTIRNNIAFGRPDIPQAQIEAAARIANAHGFITQLEGGYEAMAGERGMALSGGQRQRLCIARAILHEPDILILDEATSALDSESEKLVQEALDRVTRDRTSIIIAHRLSTILNADKIVVIVEGDMVEVGTHAQLLAQEGMYARLYHLQFGNGEAPGDASQG
ncbi:MAG: ABC transporter ATP-binding protein [Bacteroidetes bacterium]|nr:ABC transporter ATP-binding protein [Bacteroidota bacterium]